MSSNKWLALYIQTRFPVSRYVPLSFFLAAAGLAPVTPVPHVRWIFGPFLALSLVLQLRLWDDIADRDHDRKMHPDRVLCQAEDLRPFVVAAFGLFVLNGFLILVYHSGIAKLLAYLTLCACLQAWYCLRSSVARDSVVNTLYVLLKYPVVAWLVSVSTADRHLTLLLLCLFSVYLISIIFELLDDLSIRQKPGAMFSLSASFCALVCTWILIMLWSRPFSSQLAWVLWVIVLIATLMLGYSAYSKLKHGEDTLGGRRFFMIGLLAYIATSVENTA